MHRSRRLGVWPKIKKFQEEYSVNMNNAALIATKTKRHERSVVSRTNDKAPETGARWENGGIAQPVSGMVQHGAIDDEPPLRGPMRIVRSPPVSAGLDPIHQ